MIIFTQKSMYAFAYINVIIYKKVWKTTEQNNNSGHLQDENRLWLGWTEKDCFLVHRVLCCVKFL